MFALVRQAVVLREMCMLEGSSIDSASIGAPWVDGLIKDPFVEDCGPLINDCDGSIYLKEGDRVDSTPS